MRKRQESLRFQLSKEGAIIKGEPLIAMELKRYSVELGHVVSGTARTRSRAMEIARREPLRICRRLQLLRDWSHDESSYSPEVLA